MERPKSGEWFLCHKTVTMKDDGEVVYKKGEFYKSEIDNCITNLFGEQLHYWRETDWTKFFKKWTNHKKKKNGNSKI